MLNRRTVLGLSIAVGLMSTISAGAQTIQLKVADVQVGTPHAAAVEKFAALVTERSGGAVTVTAYTGTQLGGEKDLMDSMRSGSLEMVHAGVTGYPALDALWAPFLFRDADHLMKFTESKVAQGFADSMAKDWGVRVIGWTYLSPRVITNSKRPIETVADLKGLKIRTPQIPIMVEAFKAMGASPTPMAWPEVYTSLQMGAIDGQENPLQVIFDAKLNEVQKYLTVTNHVLIPRFLLINEASWQALSQEQQEILTVAWKEVAAEARAKLEAGDQDYLQKLESSGLTISEFKELDAMRAAVRDVQLSADKVWGDGTVEAILAIQ
jgi:tripartite ATP-independent transporter DctP family solute receptor